MATTCVLGHPWNDGMVLCPTCGFGRRNLPQDAVPAQAAAPLAEQVTSPVLAHAGGAGYGAAGDPVAAPEPERILSPDGQWAWDGTAWVPASMLPEPVAAPEPAAAQPADEPADDGAPRGRRGLGTRAAKPAKPAKPARSRRAAKAPKADRAKKTPKAAKAGSGDPHRIDPRLLLGGAVVLAALVGGDLALGLPRSDTQAPPPPRPRRQRRARPRPSPRTRPC